MKQLKITTRITSRDSESIDKYLNDIARLPLISHDEEVALAKRIKLGDEKAMHQLIRANLRFVVSVAKQYQSQGMSLNDLINEGNIGLIKAASKFDETKGFKFISYAVWWIRQSILQALIELPRMVRLPMNKAALYSKINRAIDEFAQANLREPSNEELAELLEMDKHDLNSLRASLTFHSSTDAPLSDDDSTSFVQIMEDTKGEKPDKVLLKESMQDDIQRALGRLSTREHEIINYYYGLNGFRQSYSLEEIGRRLNLTRERVRQLRDKALRKMRRDGYRDLLKGYVN